MEAANARYPTGNDQVVTRNSQGTVFGVGVGPGDPELLTLKALRILRSAPVLAWPALENQPSMARKIASPHLPGNQREIPIRMPLAAEYFPVSEIYDKAAAAIGHEIETGQDVAVICEGDPFFYGSFMYLFARLADRYRTEVIPGVSSLTACAAVLGTPLSAGSDVLSVVPGSLPAAAMAKRVRNTEAAAFVKVGRHAPKIRAVLEELELAEQAWYVERATMAEQVVLPLSELGDRNAPYFSMILVHKRGKAWR